MDNEAHQEKRHFYKYCLRKKVSLGNLNIFVSHFCIYLLCSAKIEINMGGPLKMTELKNYDGLWINEKNWEIFFNGGLTPYFLAMKGYNRALSTKCYNSWQDDVVIVGIITFLFFPSLLQKSLG